MMAHGDKRSFWHSAREQQPREGIHDLGLLFDFRQQSEMPLDMCQIKLPSLSHRNRLYVQQVLWAEGKQFEDDEVFRLAGP